MFSFGVSGTRYGMNSLQIAAAKYILQEIIASNEYGVCMHNGSAIGADAQFFYLFKEFDDPYLLTIGHPSNIKADRHLCAHLKFDQIRKPFAPLVRNQHIVDESDLLIAAPAGPEDTSGTWSTIRRARKKKIPVQIIYPDGRVLV